MQNESQATSDSKLYNTDSRTDIEFKGLCIVTMTKFSSLTKVLYCIVLYNVYGQNIHRKELK